MSTKHQCSKRVFSGARWDTGGHQCTKRGKVEVDGKWYCAIHSPDGETKRNAAWREKFDAERADADARYALEAKRDADAKLGASIRNLPKGHALMRGFSSGLFVVLNDGRPISQEWHSTPEQALSDAGVC